MLGNKLPEEDLSKGVPKKADEIREIANRGNLFLVVGTLEPRKGHASVLDLADTLWSKNDEASFLFIGKRGWEVDGLIKRIKGHQQYEQKLFWMERCSDEFLVELYKASTGLLATSFAEGYSLPIVEAQYFGLPVLARELPIYREVAEKYPAITFFPSHDKDALLDYFLRWRKGLKSKNRVKKLAGKEICWKKATKDLQKIIID